MFLSYAREDQDAVLELARAIETTGFTVFLDRDIRPGVSYEDIIETKLNDARCVVVVWSQASVASRWVRAEAETGATRGVLVPILIEDVRVPLPFRGLETVDLVGWPVQSNVLGVQRLMKALDSNLSNNGLSPAASRQMRDPTLSVRVAQRVVDGLGVRRLSPETQVVRAIADSCVYALTNGLEQEIVIELINSVGDCFGASGVWIEIEEMQSGSVAIPTRSRERTIVLNGHRIKVMTDAHAWCVDVRTFGGSAVAFSGEGDSPNEGSVHALDLVGTIVDLFVNR